MQQPLKARVQNGRLVLDEPTSLPDGIEVDLVFADVVFADGDELDGDERRELYGALLEGSDELDAGQGEDMVAVIAELEART
jgi:hypothetical protein